MLLNYGPSGKVRDRDKEEAVGWTGDRTDCITDWQAWVPGSKGGKQR